MTGSPMLIVRSQPQRLLPGGVERLPQGVAFGRANAIDRVRALRVCRRDGGLSGVPVTAAARTGAPQALEIALPAMRRFSDNVWLGELTPRVWIHITTEIVDGIGYYPANGAIVIDGSNALLIDTGWNDGQADAIVSAWERLRKPAISQYSCRRERGGLASDHPRTNSDLSGTLRYSRPRHAWWFVQSKFGRQPG